LVKFSRTSGCALQALVLLAERGEQQFFDASRMAEPPGLSADFLSNALKQLTRTGALQSLRGPGVLIDVSATARFPRRSSAKKSQWHRLTLDN
jgi:hypothetical protein